MKTTYGNYLNFVKQANPFLRAELGSSEIEGVTVKVFGRQTTLGESIKQVLSVNKKIEVDYKNACNEIVKSNPKNLEIAKRTEEEMAAEKERLRGIQAVIDSAKESLDNTEIEVVAIICDTLPTLTEEQRSAFTGFVL